MQKATTLNEVSGILNGDPLELIYQKDFYQELASERGDDIIKHIQVHLNDNPYGQDQILFMGPRGCGKSTELNRLKGLLGDDFSVLSFSVRNELDYATINYVELIMLTMEKLFNLAQDENLTISEGILDLINDWTKKEEIQEISSYTDGAEVEIGVGGEVGIPFFVKFFSKLRLSAKNSYNNKKTITEAVEKKISDLLEYSNMLLREVKTKLKAKGKTGFAIVIEDLDKVPIDRATELFSVNGNVLTALEANVIFTFPIAMRFNSNFNVIYANFNCEFTLPMVKVRTVNGDVYQSGRDLLLALLTKRLNEDLFENKDVIYSFIDSSGGCIRDLFRMIINASIRARIDDRPQITKDDYEDSRQKLKRSYAASIAEYRESNKVIVSVKEYYDTLINLVNDAHGVVDNTLASLDLRHNLCILSYNGTGWSAVHPLVKLILEERGMI